MTRWMSLDVGSKRVGVALSDPLKMTARPLTTLPRTSLEQDARNILELVREHDVDRLIVGRPRHLDGRESEAQAIIEPLADLLRERLPCPVEWAEERLSSREAERLMARQGVPVAQRRRRRDAFAAALILQWHLEESRPE